LGDQASTMRIRKATITDLEAIIALNALVQQRHADALPELFKAPAQSQQITDAFRGFLADPNSLILLAEETQPAGYLWGQFLNRPASWARFEMQLLYVQHMVVAPPFRRKGTGTLLLTSAVETARSQGIKRVELDVWSFNAEARRFYAKNGFEIFNERMALKMEDR
jgi:diamine N-acetyltransferase